MLEQRLDLFLQVGLQGTQAGSGSVQHGAGLKVPGKELLACRNS